MSLTLLKDHDPAAGWRPDPDRARRLDETVRRRWAEEPGGAEAEAARGRRSDGRRARLVLAGAALVAAAVVAILVLPGSETRPGAAPASAAEVLRAAQAATPQDGGGSGPWSYNKDVHELPEPFTKPDGGRGVALFTWTTERWMNDDGTERMRATRDDTPRFPTQADRAAWTAGDHHPRRWPQEDKVLAIPRHEDGDTIASARALPRDPAALEAELTRQAEREHATLVYRVGLLLASPAPDPELRAALIGVLERQPNGTLERDLRAPDGRVGDGVRFVTPLSGRQDEDRTFVFDRTTHRFIGILGRGTDAAGKPTADWRVVVTMSRTSSAPPADADH